MITSIHKHLTTAYPDPFHLDVFVLVGVLLLFSLWATFSRRSFPPLPPGPTPWPIVGNLFSFPKETHTGRFWANHKKLYGPISCVTAMGTPFIILNDMDAALTLLEKRSALYASRYENTFGATLVNVTRWTAFMPFGPELKRHRKLIQTYIGTVASMSGIETVERAESFRLLFGLLEDPSNVIHLIRRHAAAVILKISHGYTIETKGADPLVGLAEEVVDEILFSSVSLGTWAVDILPLLRHLPSWLPGMTFKRTAQSWKATFSEFGDKPYAFVKKQMAEGKDKSSFTSYNIEKGLAESERDETTLKDGPPYFTEHVCEQC